MKALTIAFGSGTESAYNPKRSTRLPLSTQKEISFPVPSVHLIPCLKSSRHLRMLFHIGELEGLLW